MSKENLIIDSSEKSVVAESYRVMRTNLMYSSIDKKIKTLAITSAGPGEGKTVTACNLAIAFAHAGSKVIVLDIDLRKPRVHKYFGVSNRSGMTSIIVEGLVWSDYVYVIEELPNLHILTSGPIPPNPSELIGSLKMKNFINSLKEFYDYIIIDTAPVGVVTDAALIGGYADGTLLVVASGDVEIEAARHSKEQLQKVNANILGVVLNRIPTKGNGYYKYYSYYSYYHDDDEGDKKKKKRKLI